MTAPDYDMPRGEAAERRAAIRRAAAATPWGLLGCLKPIIAAWPAAFDGMAARAFADIYKAQAVEGVLRAAFGLPLSARYAIALPGDVALVRVDGQAVAGLFAGVGILIGTPEGFIAGFERDASQFWRAPVGREAKPCRP